MRCLKCQNVLKGKKTGGPYLTKSLPDGEIKIENSRQILFFDSGMRFLNKIFDKKTGRSEKLTFEIGAYPTLAGENGAYIFMRDPERNASFNSKIPADVIGTTRLLGYFDFDDFFLFISLFFARKMSIFYFERLG